MGQGVDIKTFTKGMNKDVDPRFLQPGEYIDAQNIMLSSYRDSKGGGVTNFPGLLRRYDSSATTVGLFKDELNNVLYIFSYVSAGSKTIIRYNLGADTTTPLLDTSVLPWTANTIIKSCKIIEGILVWTDGGEEIGMFDTTITYPTPYTAEMFTLAQLVPRSKPAIVPTIDNSYGYNNIVGKFFQFKYRFIYMSGFKSVFSPISDVAYSIDDFASPTSVAAKNAMVNSIVLTLTGDGASEVVTKIEIAARSGNNGDFFSITEIDATPTFQGGGNQTYTFYNESLYDPIALKESNQIMDDVPRTAQALEIADNRVILGDVLTGYDKMDVDYDLAVVYANALNPEIQRLDTELVTPGTTRYGMQSGVELAAVMLSEFAYAAPVAGDTITVSGKSVTSGGVPVDYSYPFGYVSYEIQFGDSWNDVYVALTTPEWYQIYPDRNLSIEEVSSNNAPPPTGNDAFVITLQRSQHVPTGKSGAWYNVGIQYFDKYGRTNGTQVKEGAKAYIKTLGERGLTPGSYDGAGEASINVTINSDAPSWARYYKIVYSRANFNEFTLQIATAGASNSGVANILLNLGTVVAWNDEAGGNLAYQWEKGDRIKILTVDQGGDIFTDWAGSLLDAEIIGDDSTGDYSIIIPAYSGQARNDCVTELNTGAIIEVYRPSKELDATDSIFTEAGPDFEVYESSGRYFHRGNTDQTASVNGQVEFTGDAWLRSRQDFPYGTGADTAAIAFESYEISDYRDSAHYDKGRPTAIINQEESQRVSTLFYSETVIPNTDINNLNRFFPDVNYEEYDKPFGRIKYLHSENDHLLMLQEDRASKVYINRAMMYDGKGNNQLIGTRTRVLSKSVPYAGLYGIHDHRTFQAIGNRRYWLDASRGVVLRLSQNGIEEISRYGMRGWFAEQSEALMDNANDTATSVYDVQNDLYVLHLDLAGKTLYFDEKTNAWVSFITYINAEHSTFINNRSFVIENDDLYEMNYHAVKNYRSPDGSAAASFIEFPSNIEPADLKNFFAIAIDGSHALDVVITTEALYGGTDQSSTLDRALDFRQRETEWHAAFLRDINTPKLDPLMSGGDWTARVLFLGDTMKGKSAVIKLTHPVAVGDQPLSIKLVKIVVSKG